MIYAMSDIHGQYEQFLTLLEQIGIRKEDTLYILGDVVDRGPEPMKILKYMMAHSNIIPIIGNHEVMALPNLKLLVPEVSRNFLDKLPPKVYRDFANWTQNNPGFSQTAAGRTAPGSRIYEIVPPIRKRNC